LTVALSVAPLALVVAFHQQTPARDAPAPSVGLGIIGGTIVADDAQARPVRHATVNLNGGPAGGGRAGGNGSRMTVTDDAGRFLFTALPAGRYTISASKPGWVGTAYGAKRPGQASSVGIVLDHGQQLPSLTMRMAHGAAITGRISADGRALPQNLQVRALRFQMVRGQRQLVSANAQTMMDERGVYRIYGLAPGDYVVAVQPPNGQGTEVREPSMAELQWAQQLIPRPAAASATPAPGAAPVATPDLPPPPAPSQPIGYSPVYYPGTVTSTEATPITVRAGEERTGADFVLHFVPTATVSGSVTDPEGRPLQSVQLLLMAQTSMAGLNENHVVQMMGGDGRFIAKGVPPGSYTLTAHAVVRQAAPPGPPPAPPGAPTDPVALEQLRAAQDTLQRALQASQAGGIGPIGGPGRAGGLPQVMLWAVTDVFVDGMDVPDLDLRLQTGMTVSGRIAFDTIAPPPDPEKTRVNLSWNGPNNVSLMGNPSGVMAANGTFTLTNVVPGQYLVNASAPAATFVKSVVINGGDVTDFGFEVRPNQSLANVVVTLTDKRAEVDGTLIDGTGKPTADYFVVILPTDKALWQSNARRPRSTRPDTTGKYTIAGLAPGEYFLSAVTDLDQSDLSDPAFLAQLAASAFKFTLADGEKKTQDMKIAGGGL
jgi:protocatechuate 3,4-dioxygenase beta subunit